METQAVLLSGPKDLALAPLGLARPGADDIVVEPRFTGISTGTENLFWSGRMPPFPGMGYPLVPGYEAVGEVVEAPRGSGLKAGDTVFVPGANCYDGARGLFGASASRVVTAADRVAKVDAGLGADAVLLALAATARHAMAGMRNSPPDLIIGHGVLGRLLARLTLAAGAPAPRVHEINPVRQGGAQGYEVLHPDADERRDYEVIYDASGHGAGLDEMISRLARGGELVLVGFYPEPLQFAFPPAFMREARLRVAAEWAPDDLQAVRSLIDGGALSLDGLLTHRRPARDAAAAYEAAFGDPTCLKMTLDWKDVT